MSQLTLNFSLISFKKIELYAKLLLLAMLWSPAAVMTKYLLAAGFSSLSIVALSSLIASLSLCVINLLTDTKMKLSLKQTMHSFAMAFIVQVAPFICFVKSLEYIDTIWSAIILATIPLITMFLASKVFPNSEKLSANRIMAGIIGFTGLVIIFSSTKIGGVLNLNSLIGMLFAFSSSVIHACGMIYSKKYLGKTKPQVASLYQTLLGGIYLLPFVSKSHIVTMVSNVEHLQLIAGIGILTLAIPYMLYYHIVQKYGAFRLSTVNYILPIIKTLAGVVFLNEVISGRFLIAAALVLTALFLAD